MHRTRRLSIAACLLAAGALLAFVVAGPSGAAFPGTNGKIAFSDNSGGNLDVYTVNADGTGIADITNVPGDNGQPAYSADGSKIVFYSDRQHATLDREIYSMNADGSNQVDLSNNSKFDGDPAWSPDGKQIVFISSRGGTNALWVMNADGSNQHALSTADWNLTCWSGFPRWSPDGTKVVFQHQSGCTSTPWHIDVANADGTGTPIDLTSSSSSDDTTPEWSPDGTKIAYTAGSDIWVMNADGSNQTQITTGGGNYPRWSPDGTQIVFNSPSGGIYRVAATGGTPQPVIVPAGGVAAYNPDWQPVPVQTTTTTTTTQTTTTNPPPPPGPPQSVTLSVGKAKGLTLAASIVCNGPAGANPCSVLVALTTVEHIRSGRVVAVSARRTALRKRTVKLAQKVLTAPPGARTSFTLSLNRTGKALLRHFHTLPARLTTTLTNAAAGRPSASKKVVFKAPRKKKH